MPFVALTNYMAFCHLSLLAFLLGTQIYQSFFANITASRASTRGQFRVLQAAIWPMYFNVQSVTSHLLALTYPHEAGGGKANSWLGVLEKGHRGTVTVPLLMMIVLSAVNVYYLTPQTISNMWKLHLESVREGKEDGKPGEKSPELKALNKRFLTFHGASYGCNMAVIGLSVWYAFCIADRYL